MDGKKPGLFDLRVLPPPLTRRLLGAGAVALLILVWFLVTRGPTPEQRFVSPVILPSPLEVVRSFGALWNERALAASIIATLRRVLIGFGLAIVVGVPLGIMAGAWRVFEATVMPVALFSRNIPVAALIPLTILWFGIEETQKVMFIFIACVPFVYSDAVGAITSVPDRYVETAATLGASQWQMIAKVLVPLALPDIYKSLRSLFGLAFEWVPGVSMFRRPVDGGRATRRRIRRPRWKRSASSSSSL